jgi:RIO-like serine/threonine protein kinase
MLTFGKTSECQIIRNGQTVRKRGSRVRIEESRALTFAHSLQLPVPRVHAVTASSSETEIVMDFIDGECLEEAWQSMASEQKQSIAVQVRQIVTTMRQAESDSRSKIGSFGGPARDCRQFSDYCGGPFESVSEFNLFTLDLLRGTPLAIRKTLADALAACSSGDGRIVLTHGDLTPRNIIVKEGRIQALLDWEYACWYPEYWEYVKFFERPTDCRDWKDYAEVISDTAYPRELLTFQALARWQRP